MWSSASPIQESYLIPDKTVLHHEYSTYENEMPQNAFEGLTKCSETPSYIWSVKWGWCIIIWSFCKNWYEFSTYTEDKKSNEFNEIPYRSPKATRQVTWKDLNVTIYAQILKCSA